MALKDLIHYWNDSVLTLFNPITRTKKNITFNKSIHRYADSISVGSRIFIMGGYNSSVSNEVYEVSFKSHTFIQKEPMLVLKYNHTLCKSHVCIYSIGGYNKSSLNDCEKYSITQNSWTTLATLQTERHRSAVFTFCNSQIYCLGGINNGSCIISIEKLDINESNQWEYVYVLNIMNPRQCLHGIQIGNEVIVFGSGEVGSGKECYAIDIAGTKCTRMNDLEVSSEFWSCSAPLYYNKYVYGIDYLRRIHIYSLADKKWKVI